MATHILESFAREEKTLEPDIAVSAVQDQRIDQGVDD
jgi:hypothetical protein